MKLYLVEYICYDYVPPEGIFSTREKAEECIKLLGNKKAYEITEFELDALPNL